MQGRKNQQRIVNGNAFQNACYSLVRKFCDDIDIVINGSLPGDLQVKDNKFYFRAIKCGIGINRLALGECYVNGEYDVDDLLVFFEKLFQSKLAFKKSFFVISSVLESFSLLAFNMHSKKQNKKDVSKHYDIGNDLFKLMLGKSMVYSGAYWQKNVLLNQCDNNLTKINTVCDSIEEAQLNKMLLIAKKLKLKAGMKVLDIGCGWGYQAKFLAINFDVHVIGITISKEQYEYAITSDLDAQQLEFLRVPGLQANGTGKFEFRLQDYRDVDETFDRIVVVEMIEHVGKKNYDEFFRIVHRNLNDDGIFFLHVIGIFNDYLPQFEPFINKYIFPGFMPAYHTQLIDAFYGRFVIEDWHNLGFCFYRTLVAWHDNFIANWPKLQPKYGDRFKRIWCFYLLWCAALFKARKLHLWHIVLSKDGIKDDYVSYR